MNQNENLAILFTSKDQNTDIKIKSGISVWLIAATKKNHQMSLAGGRESEDEFRGEKTLAFDRQTYTE